MTASCCWSCWDYCCSSEATDGRHRTSCPAARPSESPPDASTASLRVRSRPADLLRRHCHHGQRPCRCHPCPVQIRACDTERWDREEMIWIRCDCFCCRSCYGCCPLGRTVQNGRSSVPRRLDLRPSTRDRSAADRDVSAMAGGSETQRETRCLAAAAPAAAAGFSATCRANPAEPGGCCHSVRYCSHR